MSDDKFSLDSLDRSYHSRQRSGIRSLTPGHKMQLYQQEVKELRETVKFIEYHLAMTNQHNTQLQLQLTQSSEEIERLKECLTKETELRLRIAEQNAEVRREMHACGERQKEINEHHTAQVMLYEQKLATNIEKIRRLEEKNVLCSEELQNLRTKNQEVNREKDRLFSDMNSLICLNEKLNKEINQLKKLEKKNVNQSRKINMLETEIRKVNNHNAKLWQVVKNSPNPVLQFSRLNLKETRSSRKSSETSPKSEELKITQEPNIQKLIKDVITELDTPTKPRIPSQKYKKKLKSPHKPVSYRRNGSKTLDSTKAESHEEHRIVEKLTNESLYAQKQFSDLLEDYFQLTSETPGLYIRDDAYFIETANKLFVDFTNAVISYLTPRNN